MSMDIRVELTRSPKQKPDFTKLGFGQVFSDHMFVMDYTEGKGWHDPRIVPYGPLSLEPSSMVFHYGQEIFEGLKAYRRQDGSVWLFRPDQNANRLNRSGERLSIPPVDPAMQVEAIRRLVEIEKDWVPDVEGTSLYIRPFVIATDPYVGVRPSQTYKYIVILSPVGAYYPEGLDPVRIYIETEYVRASKGGTGFTKCGGNYAASLNAQYKAKKKGYSQVLWLDAKEHKYVEEVGTMNVFFVLGDEVVTPALEGSILPGITRDSCLKLLSSWGLKVSERKISVEELFEAGEKGLLTEAFGTGTAAVISPIRELNWDGRIVELSGGKIGELSQKLYDTVTGIQWGGVQDPFGWTIPVEK